MKFVFSRSRSNMNVNMDFDPESEDDIDFVDDGDFGNSKKGIWTEAVSLAQLAV